MSMYAVDGEILNGIAHAIQSKTGSDEPMTVAAMASAIEGISGAGIPTAAGVYAGVVEVNEDSPYLIIPHNLGRVCKVNTAVDITETDPLYSNPAVLYASALIDSAGKLFFSNVRIANNNGTGYLGSTMTNTTYSPEFETMYTKFARSQYYNPVFKAGHKYLCVCY